VNPEAKDLMRISITGKSNNRGFTLIELIVVIALIGIILGLATPVTRNFFTGDNLKKAARELIGLDRKLRTEAVREQTDYILCLDLPTSSYWIETADMTEEKAHEMKKSAKRLPAGVVISAVMMEEGRKITEGELRIRFGKNNISPPMVINLGRGEEHMTIVVNPYLGVTGVYDEYVDVSFEEGLGSNSVK